MKDIIKKTANIAFWILLFLTITIGISVFKASDLKPSVSLNGMEQTNGEKFDSQNRVSVVYFWATWCGVCSTNVPLVQWYSSLLEKSDRFSFVSVEEGEDALKLSNYIRERDIRFKVIPGNSKFLNEWKVNAFPAFFILDRNGVIRFADTGIMNPLSLFLRIWISSFFF
ncbi:thioredoxin-like domain-containing protein [Leptospira stimsonii]|uniref:TlpA family protein disulfide reductase n=1 Tax=Leptospira stimsonii TaxID=2202203 RepID=A0ABY2MUF7_9LEPT|nr:thioredoxin-like domain-containing protein [Leptospira stimsonii]TGK15441.1 TlpA family protein disulfide reductase [Leptospira stimsonii]TGM08305.1 TlpA family protein disulfide reductase [Leptospira stimsonii]